MSRRWLAGLAVLAAALLTGLFGSVLAAGLFLSAPDRSTAGPPPALIAGAEAVHLPSGSRSVLQGWWMAGQPGGGAVVLMHGVHGNRLGLVRRARLLSDTGFAVLLFDFQAHGESTGQRITFGKLESLDAAAAVQFVHSRAPGEQVGAVGISLGGAAALVGPEPLDVDALVLESVYPTIDAALSNRLRAAIGTMAGPMAGPMIGTLAAAVLTPLFNLLLPPILGVQPGELRPIDRIGQVRVPVLVASGTADDRTPLTEAQSLFDHAPDAPGKHFWPVQGAAHVDLERHDPEGYRRVVLPFLQQHLQRAP